MPAPEPAVSRQPFGTLPDGRTVERITLSEGGIRITVLTLGGIIQSIEVPDRQGVTASVALGFADLDSYLERSPYFGCIVGRYANRIAAGRFTLDGVEHVLATNEPPNHLHGGTVGFDKRLWEATEIADGQGVGVRLAYASPDGEEGYPGTLRVDVAYRLTSGGELWIDYRAETAAPTVVN